MDSGPIQPSGRYSDLQRPPLRAGDLSRAVQAGSGRWREVQILEQTGSTNADLAGDPDLTDGVVLVAEHQSGGRGRLDRTWSSPPRAGLTFSVCIAPAWPRTSWGWVSLAAGVALAAVAQEEAGLANASVKWPNDLLLGDRKAAGILAEVVSERLVVVGIGLNVTTTAAELSSVTATSLRLENASSIDRGSLLLAFLRRFDHLLSGSVSEVREQLLQRCSTIGSAVSVQLPDSTTIEGNGLDVDHEGRLVVETWPSSDLDGNSVTRAFAAGDVRHVRRA